MSCSALTLLTTCFECKQVTVMALIISVNVSCSDIKLRADMHIMPPCRVEALTGVGLLLPATTPSAAPAVDRHSASQAASDTKAPQADRASACLAHYTAALHKPCSTMSVSLDGRTAVMGELHMQTRCCAASSGDTHCGIQVGGAPQQTDQWVF